MAKLTRSSSVSARLRLVLDHLDSLSIGSIHTVSDVYRTDAPLTTVDSA